MAEKLQPRIFWGLEQFKKRAFLLAEAGKKCHPHFLPDNCRFNLREGRLPLPALILENLTDNQVFVVRSNNAPKLAAVSSELLQLFQGEKAVAETDAPIVSGDGFEAMFRRAQELTGKEKWHFHIFSPGCVLNPDKNMWTLVFEDPITGELLTSTAKERFSEDIRLMESLYFSQM